MVARLVDVAELEPHVVANVKREAANLDSLAWQLDGALLGAIDERLQVARNDVRASQDLRDVNFVNQHAAMFLDG
jgi:hypothetical protein